MLSLRIALRYLFSRKSHSAVNIISFISLAGVAVATVATVCVLSVFNGFTDLAKARMSRMDPALQVTRTDGRPLEQADSLARELTRMEGVSLALPTLTGQALAMYGDKQLPVTIKGVPAGYERISGIDSLFIEGQYVPEGKVLYPDVPNIEDWQYAALSIGVAVQLASPYGFTELLGIYVPRRLGRINPANPMGSFAADSLIISGVWEVQQQEYDNDMVILPLSAARRLLEYDMEATAIEVSTADPDGMKATLQAALGPDYLVKTRLEQQEQSYRMISIEKWISFLLLAFILIIASFNIISTLSILIIEKRDNMATLTALGAPRRLLSRIFMIEGWLIAFGGGVIGIIVGVALCLCQQWFGWIKLAGDASQLTIDSYPVKVEAVDLLAVLALVALVGLLSTAVTRRFVRAHT